MRSGHSKPNSKDSEWIDRNVTQGDRSSGIRHEDLRHSSILTCRQALTRGLDRDGVAILKDQLQMPWQQAWKHPKQLTAERRRTFEKKHRRRSRPLAISDRVLLKDQHQRSRDLGKMSTLWKGGPMSCTIGSLNQYGPCRT